MEMDRMSYLPGNIIDQILMRLPLKDGARTSVLSRNWKYKFAELPYLTISPSEFPRTPMSKIVSAVDHILMLHIGLIIKVRLELFDDYDALNRWIIYLSRSRTKEFEIELYDNDYRLPSSFYAWRNLTTLLCSHLSLTLPAQFAGFPNLKSLELQYVEIDEKDLDTLIFGCPLLERLTIDLCSNLINVKINAPNLKFLYFQNEVEFLSFENTHRLAQVFLRSYIKRPALHEYTLSSSSCSDFNPVGNLVKFFAQLPGIQFLDVDFCFLEYLTTGVDPGNVPILCESLECLGIGANLNDQADCLRALCIFIICPNLTELTIKIVSISCKESYNWNEDYGHSMFTKLQYAEITGVRGTEPELGLIKFMLLNTPVLEKMVIRPANKKCQLGLLKNLVTFRRISAHSRILCLD